MYTIDQLKEDVKKEAEALKVHATKEELGRLDFETFDGCDFTACIYGQITGSCASERAHDLISSCCTRYINNEKYWPDSSSLDNVARKSSLSRVDLDRFRNGSDKYVDLGYISAIEAYIMRREAKNANLIAFLKGESETLEL